MIVFVSGSLHLVWFLSGFICIVANGSVLFLKAEYCCEDIGSFFIIWLRLCPLFGYWEWWCSEHWNSDVFVKWGFYFLVDHLEGDFFFFFFFKILLRFPFLFKVKILPYSPVWLGTHYIDQTSLILGVVLLPLLHTWWVYRCVPPSPTLIWRFSGLSAPYWNFGVRTSCDFGICTDKACVARTHESVGEVQKNLFRCVIRVNTHWYRAD